VFEQFRDEIGGMDSNEPSGARAQLKAAKRAQIVEAAREVFYLEGYTAATMTMIQERANCSRATLYAHFATKEALFAAIIRDTGDQMLQRMRAQLDGGDLRTALLEVGRAAADVALSDWGVRTLQLIIEEIRRTPVLAEVVREAMVETDALMEAILAKAQAAGRIQVADITEAGAIFKGLLSGDILLKRLLDLVRPTEAEIDAHIEKAVDVFLKYAAPADGGMQ